MPRDGRQIVEVGQILHAHRQVEPHLLADGLLGLNVAPLPHQHPRRIGRQNREQKEHQRDDAQHKQEAIKYSFDDKTKHA